ncbi:MAG: hypothetical protein Q8910_06580, partial [Bacteroidota bacterium]|nr:hypothetical protein [Bacteroidota bacterium]
LLTEFIDFMNGKKTWTGITMLLLGTFHLPQWLCGELSQTACATQIVQAITSILVIGGFALSIYGNWKAHKK